MATHQDCWKNNGKSKDGDKRAREWLESLQIGDKLLHPKPNITYNRCDPSGKDFEIVSIASKTTDSVIISYPNMNKQWDTSVPLKYAFAVRPVGSIKARTESQDEETLSQSSNSSDASMVAPEQTVPFPHNDTTKHKNIQNEKEKVQFTFDKKQTKRALNPGRDHKKTVLGVPETTPPFADKTCFNRLHETRHKSRSTSPTMKKTYAESRGSKNRRNRAIAAKSSKMLGHLKKDQQCKEHQKKQKQELLRVNKHKQEEDEKRDTTIDDERNTICRNGSRSSSYAGHRDSCFDDDSDENKGPMTRNKHRQQREKQYVSHKNTPDWLNKSASLREPIGLQNMGNTCFMNSTLQSLIHTEELRHFFLNNEENKWLSEQLNTNNPIGYGGKIALSFSKLVYKQCEESDASSRSYYSAIKPNMIHYNLTGTLRQFADFRQHDAQEFMTNFLDGLHEDLNRIKKKKYLEIPDFGAKDEENIEKRRGFLHKRWHEIYLRRNHSVCTDLFAGLLKSTVTCPACDFTAITFDPFMHLLLPLKAPKSMLRARGSFDRMNVDRNHNNNHKRGRFDATDDEEDETEGEQDKYKELTIHFIPKHAEDSPVRFVIKINEEIGGNNDWITLHCMVYDHLMKRFVKHEEGEMSPHMEDDIAVHRLQMIKSSDYTADEHYAYYGMDDVDTVKQQYAERKIPKCINAQYITPFPIFRLYELYQDNKVLNLQPICKQNFNVNISDYINGGGHRRLCVQQLPSHWTDPMRMSQEEDHALDCYLVFKKPSYEKQEDVDEDDDLLCGNKGRKGSSDETECENEEIPFEPFSYPRVIFNKGLTTRLSEENCAKYLQRMAQQVAISIAGNDIMDRVDNMEIRYCRNEEDRYALDKIAKWNRVMMDGENTNNNNSNSQAAKPIHTIVIVFSFDMHQIYTQYQRDLELKEHNSDLKKHNKSSSMKKGRKRTYQAMNGGNSRYNDDSVNCVSRKRQKTNDNYRAHNGYRNRQYHNENSYHEEDDVRDASLPLSFQPKETMAQTINECFGIFLSREQLGRDNRWFCKKCKDHVQGRKKLDLWWLPSHLIIAIKRFDNHGLRKYPNHVQYPVNGLDLSEIIRGRDTLDIYHNEHDAQNIAECSSTKHKKEKFIYDLYAVINHSGSLNFGHYTATIKFDDSWYNISDSSVSPCSNPISSQAYILCYKKQQQPQ